MALLAFYIFLAIAVSFLCSVMEAVLLSVTPGHLAAMEAEGAPTAARLRKLKDAIDEPLAAILTLNTIAHTVGAAGAGAQAAVVFGDAYLGAFSGVLTLAILFLSEIIPKTIGAVHWKRLTPFVTTLLVWLMIPLKPFVWMSGFAKKLITGGEKDLPVSREELGALANLGAEVGVLDPGESRILQALLRFRSLEARDVMTPRTVVFGLPATMKAGEVLENHDSLQFSRIPIFVGSLDKITGYVLKDDVLERVARDEHDVQLGELERPLAILQNVTPLPTVLERLLESRQSIARVVDQYGGTAGLVTLEDVVETLLDLEIVDEVDSIEDLRAAARRDWVRRARKMGILEAE